VIDGKKGEILVPAGRYAKMRNVWFIPSIAELVHWLETKASRKIVIGQFNGY
jgi:tRNA (mo5U34)-methyltransferase